MTERRTESRKRILKTGRIEFGIGTIECAVRNVSSTGAALEVENPVGIPDLFDLFIVADNVRRRAYVAWRRGKRVGVRFG
jgi:hypothetical protein